MPSSRKAVVLLSGGLDSATILAIARQQDFDVYALTFAYGQRHAHEIQAAKRVAEQQGVKEHRAITIDLRAFGGSSLTDDVDLPTGRDLDSISTGIPLTYVPARNTIFLSYALAWAEVLECWDVFIGVNALDYSGYPDCRPEFIQAFEKMANLATKAAVEGSSMLRIHTPLIEKPKSEIIALGLSLGVDYSLTSTCYDPDESGQACGICDACILRLQGFEANGVSDPVPYRPQKNRAS